MSVNILAQRSHIRRDRVQFVILIEPLATGFRVRLRPYVLGARVHIRKSGDVELCGAALGALVAALVASGQLVAIKSLVARGAGTRMTTSRRSTPRTAA